MLISVLILVLLALLIKAVFLLLLFDVRITTRFRAIASVAAATAASVAS